MQLLPENSRRRENVIAGFAAAFVTVAMIAVAGKASAADPAPSHASHLHAAPITDAPANAPAKPKKVEGQTDTPAHPAAHHDHGTAQPAAQEPGQPPQAPEPNH